MDMNLREAPRQAPQTISSVILVPNGRVGRDAGLSRRASYIPDGPVVKEHQASRGEPGGQASAVRCLVTVTPPPGEVVKDHQPAKKDEQRNAPSVGHEQEEGGRDDDEAGDVRDAPRNPEPARRARGAGRGIRGFSVVRAVVAVRRLDPRHRPSAPALTGPAAVLTPSTTPKPGVRRRRMRLGLPIPAFAIHPAIWSKS